MMNMGGIYMAVMISLLFHLAMGNLPTFGKQKLMEAISNATAANSAALILVTGSIKQCAKMW